MFAAGSGLAFDARFMTVVNIATAVYAGGSTAARAAGKSALREVGELITERGGRQSNRGPAEGSADTSRFRRGWRDEYWRYERLRENFRSGCICVDVRLPAKVQREGGRAGRPG